MKGISNRQKMVVKPRESVQKYVSQLKVLRKSMSPDKVRRVGRKERRGNEQ
jgi:hypothetical protein